MKEITSNAGTGTYIIIDNSFYSKAGLTIVVNSNNLLLKWNSLTILNNVDFANIKVDGTIMTKANAISLSGQIMSSL